MIRWPVWLWGKWKGEKRKGKGEERGVTLCLWSLVLSPSWLMCEVEHSMDLLGPVSCIRLNDESG